jgi:4-alpha-glucanotransferase
MTALNELAQRCGIAESSTDAFGKTHTTSEATKKALLSAMHFEVSTEEEASQSLEQFRAKHQRVLPPVWVTLLSSNDSCLPLNLPSGTTSFDCHIVLEDGTRRSGIELTSSADSGDLKLQLPANLPFGYHRLETTNSDGFCSLIVSPGKCWLPESFQAAKYWGLAVQVYLLRSQQNWGHGDFTDLKRFAEACEAHGADIVGINPVHAGFIDLPESASPYSPSDRLLLNVLYIDLEKIPEFGSCEEAQAIVSKPAFQQKLKQARDQSLLDYKAVAEIKIPLLKLLFNTFEHLENLDRRSAFQTFFEKRRDLLERCCTFQALREYFTDRDTDLKDCKDWPRDYQDVSSEAVQTFKQEHGDLVRFHVWMQWIADEQLKDAYEVCKRMKIGLYRDLAVGAPVDGGEAWSRPSSFITGATVGAPADVWNPAGQDWGLAPSSPLAAREERYASFIDLIRTNMRYAGALRIDHAPALQRLYWIPKGMKPTDGAYIAYPMRDLIGILALESQRNQCIVIGEDLGTVPEGFSEALQEANILSYKVLLFERGEGGFYPPDLYPKLSMSVANSHDLPTLRGWWNEVDLETKSRLGLFPANAADDARQQRIDDKEKLITALVRQGFLPDSKPDREHFVEGCYSYLAATNSLLTLIQLDDVLGETEQVNVPATTAEYPNWRRRYRLDLESISSGTLLSNLCKSFGVRAHSGLDDVNELVEGEDPVNHAR